jgi:hypothetical protein
MDKTISCIVINSLFIWWGQDLLKHIWSIIKAIDFEINQNHFKNNMLLSHWIKKRRINLNI